MRNKMRMMGVAIAVAGLVVTGCSSGESAPETPPKAETSRQLANAYLPDLEKCGGGEFKCYNEGIEAARDAAMLGMAANETREEFVFWAGQAISSYNDYANCESTKENMHCFAKNLAVSRDQIRVVDMLKNYR